VPFGHLITVVLVPSTSHLLAFAVTALVIIVVPGPSVLFVFGRALGLGRTAGVATVVGNTLGEYVQVLAVAFGIGALAERSVLMFTMLKLAGAGYLVYLGVQAIRHRHSLVATLAAPVERKSVARITLDGLFVGATNPKTVVFLAAILPQFIDRSAGDVPAQILLLGAIFSAIALICDSAWALAVGSARSWLARSPRRLSALGGTSGLIMIGLGTALAVSGRKD
jgi:threonine/homoserine/homoserine lactone efflux protein